MAKDSESELGKAEARMERAYRALLKANDNVVKEWVKESLTIGSYRMEQTGFKLFSTEYSKVEEIEYIKKVYKITFPIGPEHDLAGVHYGGMGGVDRTSQIDGKEWNISFKPGVSVSVIISGVELRKFPNAVKFIVDRVKKEVRAGNEAISDLLYDPNKNRA
jgi:hypothetical protein